MDALANSADPDEMAHNKPSHQDLHCLPFCFRVLTETPIPNNGYVQILRWNSPHQKLRGERVKHFLDDTAPIKAARICHS